MVALILGILTLIASLVTAGLVPLLISKNTRQHNQGGKEREEHKKLLEKLVLSMTIVETDIKTVKDDVIKIKEGRNDDKTEFLKLYEKVIQHDIRNGY